MSQTRFKKKHIPWNKNIKGEKSHSFGNQYAKGMKPNKTSFKKNDIRLLGHKPFKGTEKTRFQKGELHWNWKGGITPERKKLYFSKEYKLWRKAIFERDDYTCIWCGQKGKTLQVDHIKPWCNYPELRFAIDNGRTLCKECHKKTNTYGYNKK